MDPNLRNIFNISCDIIESPVLLDCVENAVGVPSISQKTILFPYGAGLMDDMITFRLAYSYRLCGDNEIVKLSGELWKTSPRIIWLLTNFPTNASSQYAMSL